jgi:putative tricarboxylic transport membrane protein
MIPPRERKGRLRPPFVFHALLAAVLSAAGAAAQTQGWSPQKNVEIVVGFPPGGTVDKTARMVERSLVSNKLVSSTVSVVNKPGASSSIAYTYLSQQPADGHTLVISSSTLLVNHIMGSSPLKYSDFTPIASLVNDYTVFAVYAASPMRTGRDLIERLRKDPKSVAIGFGALGLPGHISAMLLNQKIGGVAKDLKAVSFKGGADATTNLLGGHIDLLTTAAGNAAEHVVTGRMRVLAVAAPKRLGGALAGVPTWKEQGVELVFGGWRAVMAPRGLPAARVAYWEGVLRKATEFPEWKADIEKNYWSDDFVTGAQFRKDLDKEYADTKAVLVDLGLAKQ